MLDEKCTSDNELIYRISREMHFMLEGNISHFILIAPTKKYYASKIAFQILGTTKLQLGSQDPGSRKFSCSGRVIIEKRDSCLRGSLADAGRDPGKK